MNKFPLVLLLLILNLEFSSAQPGYHPLIAPNKYWDVIHYDNAQICGLGSAARYFFQGDTVIQGIQYQIIRVHPMVNINPGPFCQPLAIVDSITGIAGYMREDTVQRKVYFRETSGNNEHLFYDFTLVAGDTINGYSTSSSDLILDSVSTTTLLTGDNRNIFYLNNNEFYIEGIGSSTGLFSLFIHGIGFSYFLSCVLENNIHLWGPECYGYLSSGELNDQHSIEVYPNPAQNELVIKLTNQKGIFSLYDSFGKIIFEKIIQSNYETIDISALKDAVYFYKIEFENSSVHTGKVLIFK